MLSLFHADDPNGREHCILEVLKKLRADLKKDVFFMSYSPLQSLSGFQPLFITYMQIQGLTEFSDQFLDSFNRLRQCIKNFMPGAAVALKYSETKCRIKEFDPA